MKTILSSAMLACCLTFAAGTVSAAPADGAGATTAAVKADKKAHKKTPAEKAAHKQRRSEKQARKATAPTG